MEKAITQFLTPPKKGRLNDQILSQIKHLIFSKNLEVGERLPSERELSNQLKVSRVVIREAFRSLEQSGMVEIKPGAMGGAFVTDNFYFPLFSSVYDLFRNQRLKLSHFYEARRAVECFTIKLAAQKATRKDIQRLRTINRRLIEDVHQKERLREHNTAFHIAIVDLSGNPLLKLIAQSLFELLNQLLPESTQTSKYFKDTYDRHEAILEAMEKKDLEQCERLMAIDTEYTKKLRGIRLT